MRRRSSPTVADLLRSTLYRVERQVEQNSNEIGGLRPDEQTVRHLESSVLRLLAEMQVRRSEWSDPTSRIHLVSGRYAADRHSSHSLQPRGPRDGERAGPDEAGEDQVKAS